MPRPLRIFLLLHVPNLIPSRERERVLQNSLNNTARRTATIFNTLNRLIKICLPAPLYQKIETTWDFAGSRNFRWGLVATCAFCNKNGRPKPPTVQDPKQRYSPWATSVPF